MESIAYVSCDMKSPYEDNSFICRLMDRFKISLLEEIFVKELNLKILNIKFPFNIDEQSYYNNIKIVKKKIKSRNASLTPKVYRELDYNFLNDFQKKLVAFGIVNSSKLILRKQHKSIRDSCIVIYDAVDKINFDIICSMAREAKYIILLSEEINMLTGIAEYIIANFGIAPIITSDFNYAIKSADFIITSKGLEVDTKSAVWYLNNVYIPVRKDNIIINDVTFKAPWIMKERDISPELLGAILCQMDEKDVEKSLKYNGVLLDKIKFNNKILNL